MVKSKLVSGVDYEENSILLAADKNQEVSLYEISLFDQAEEVAIGQAVYRENNLVYYPIYLVKNEKVTKQIGLYEIFADKIPTILDADGDVDLEKMGEPLLYGFVLAEKKALAAEAEAASEADTSEAASEAASGADTSEAEADADTGVEPLLTQTAIAAAQERAMYKAQPGQHWLQTYFSNNNYRMIENEGRGDCLFAVIRDALAKVGVAKSVDEMRQLLAQNATEDIFQGYKTFYTDAVEMDKQLLKEMKTLVARHKELDTQSAAIKDRNAKQVVIKQADEILKRHKQLKKERANTKNVIDAEMKMMKNVHNLAQFKAVIKTCAFWGDTWSISTLERILNIKLILFSEESFKAGDVDNVLNCGQLNDTVLEKKGIFEPTYYIMAIYLGWHYQLVSYKDRGALTFSELPYDVKMRVVDKCLERLAGPYYIIPDFRKFMEQLRGQASTVPAAAAAQVPTSASAASAAPAAATENDIQSDLFNNATVFQFYSKSLDKPPGKGAGEVLSASEVGLYNTLGHIADWRRKLDVFWVAPFTLDGHQWNSVEHYYQGAKFKRQHPEFSLQFSLDSGSAIAKDPAAAKDPALAKAKNIKVDEDFSKRSVKELEAAHYAKFSQHADLNELLRETQRAKLQHFSRAATPALAYELMRVRQRLLEKTLPT